MKHDERKPTDPPAQASPRPYYVPIPFGGMCGDRYYRQSPKTQALQDQIDLQQRTSKCPVCWDSPVPGYIMLGFPPRPRTIRCPCNPLSQALPAPAKSVAEEVTHPASDALKGRLWRWVSLLHRWTWEE